MTAAQDPRLCQPTSVCTSLSEHACLSRFSPIWLCNAMNCSPSGSTVHGILQARILKWVAMPSSRGSPQPRDWTQVSWVSCIAGGFSAHGATWEAHTSLCRCCSVTQSCPALRDPIVCKRCYIKPLWHPPEMWCQVTQISALHSGRWSTSLASCHRKQSPYSHHLSQYKQRNPAAHHRATSAPARRLFRNAPQELDKLENLVTSLLDF